MARKEKSAFALRLRTLRKKHGLTQGDVAARLNMHRTTYTKYETDKTHVDQVYLVALAELFHVSTDYLLGKEGEQPVSLLQNSDTVTVSSQEVELLALFRRLSPEEKAAILSDSREKVSKNNE